ncbi:LacI family DNA-binding transcriptional regulator [Coraliomargarita parva]|uniref:LacI family DNA-binding transcriptional regulator n=1 Tax=Coraliomargarita parva TaxID=3014050 RepID=UPI0022B434CD|nr:LacI family DNA-binding transcriptional regulator [Coraliomargarita parva]
MNIRAIAKDSGLSVATVSRVINNESGVSEELRKKAFEAIERHGYKPRRKARKTVTRIGIVVEADAPSFNSFYSQIFSGVSRYAFDRGVETTLLFYSPSLEEDGDRPDLTELLRKKRCNGMVLVGPLSNRDAEKLVQARVPAVLVSHRLELEGIGFIDCDNIAGAQTQTEYLLGLGHRKIGYLCGDASKGDNCDRVDAFMQTMQSNGASIEPEWLVEHKPTQTSEEAGYNQAKVLLSRCPDVTAIFANNDSMAWGAITACVEMGRNVPSDISVVGYDDNSASRYFNPPLTTMRQPLEDMGAAAAKWVDEKLNNKISDLPHQVISGELMVRKSCALPRS